RKLFFGLAVAMTALPALAQEGDAWNAAARGVPLVDVAQKRVKVINPPSPDWNAPSASESDAQINSELADKLRAARRNTPAKLTDYSSSNIVNSQEPVSSGTDMMGGVCNMNGCNTGDCNGCG